MGFPPPAAGVVVCSGDAGGFLEKVLLRAGMLAAAAVAPALLLLGALDLLLMVRLSAGRPDPDDEARRWSGGGLAAGLEELVTLGCLRSGERSRRKPWTQPS